MVNYKSKRTSELPSTAAQNSKFKIQKAYITRFSLILNAEAALREGFPPQATAEPEG